MIARRPSRPLRWWQVLWAVVVVAFAVPGASRAGAADAIVLVGAQGTASTAARVAPSPVAPSLVARCVAGARACCRAVVASASRATCVRPAVFAARLASVSSVSSVSCVDAPAPPARLYLRTARLLR